MILKKEMIEVEIPSSSHIEYIQKIGDFGADYKTTYPKWDLQISDDNWKIIAIVGESGSGKSTLLGTLIEEKQLIPKFTNRPVIEEVHEDPEIGVRLFGSVGLNSMPTWLKPYNVLSVGEKYRIECAWKLSRHDNLYLDEFTSVLDRDTAMSLSVSLHKTIKRSNKRLIVSGCHRDIIEHLRPCYVVDLDKGQVFDTRRLQRKSNKLQLYRTTMSSWSSFAQYHYLTTSLPKHSTCFLVVVDKMVIGFTSCMSMPSGTLKKAFIECRTVILPKYQGIGFGTRTSELLAEYIVGKGGRFFSKTSHPIIGEYREKSKNWKPTSKNKKKRRDYSLNRSDFFSTGRRDWEVGRISYSHEWIGGTSFQEKKEIQVSLF